jgi:hypothetical protein
MPLSEKATGIINSTFLHLVKTFVERRYISKKKLRK